MGIFDLRGPDFLYFYSLLACACHAIVIMVRRFTEPTGSGQANLHDPYQIACLRGGVNEALRVAVLNLVNRGLLEAVGDKLQASGKASRAGLQHVDFAILKEYDKSRKASDVFKSEPARLACEYYTEQLESQGMVPGAGTKMIRSFSKRAAGIALAAVGAVKIVVALGRGHHNIMFLIGLMAISVGALFLYSRRTGAGDRAMEDAKERFSSLRDRAKSGVPIQSVDEYAFLVAVFGMGALEGLFRETAQKLFPRASTSSDYSGAGCGSVGCGSGGGGGGCGGGGCGGGCGGCG